MEVRLPRTHELRFGQNLQCKVPTQAAERHDLVKVGTFSDAVFTMVASFAAGALDAEHWVVEIDKVALAAR